VSVSNLNNKIEQTGQTLNLGIQFVKWLRSQPAELHRAESFLIKLTGFHIIKLTGCHLVKLTGRNLIKLTGPHLIKLTGCQLS
jgi:hypothetical protein